MHLTNNSSRPDKANRIALDSVNARAFKQSMRATAASVNVITCEHNGIWYGLTATAFCSVSTDPATVLICVNANASACEHIRESGRFCINVLGAEMEAIASAFAGGMVPEQRFQVGDWRRLSSGNPAVAGAAAIFDCRVSATLQESSHWILLGTVLACESEQVPPLVYADGRYGLFSRLSA